jgi:hypothetical protein|tara:strand:+ start:3803 stop:4615 length:813 start_codon:yes stop_codon:yes gene_type:complete
MQTTGLKRNPCDKYYTCKETVSTCIDLIKDHIQIHPEDICIEPSAGNGAFINDIRSLSNHSLFYDLNPEHNDIIQQDYLQLTSFPISKNKIHVIGNPPFGRQSSLAIQFIKTSSAFCDSISFILPKSFKKNSLQKHFNLLFHLKHSWDIPSNSFLINDKVYDVPCVFQIWVKETIPRALPNKYIPHKYNFVKKEEPHDISFRRVGVYAGKIDRFTEDKSIQSHYFIKFDEELTDELFEKISKIVYKNKENTVAAKSISKQELMEEFNKIT